MKRFFILLLVLASTTCFSQQINGTAEYVYKKLIEIDESLTDEEKKVKRDRHSKIYEKVMVLNFTNSMSTYIEKPALESENNAMYRRGFLSAGGEYISNEIFKNSNEGFFVDQREFLGKLFLVKDSIPAYKWKMTKESKIIGDFTVFEAIRDSKFQDENIKITAWYTPQIPVSNGPELFGNLPGLILEINDGDTTILCNKITLNSEQKSIQAPTRGERTNLNDFDSIFLQKRKEREADFKN